MKTVRQIGSLAFVLGLFVTVFAGIPWAVIVENDPVVPIWLGKDLSALVRLVLGGELTEYTDMMAKARATATARMAERAADMGADAVVNTRYMTTSVVGTAAELMVYGTAVKLGA